MQFKDRIQVIWYKSSIAIRFELTKGFIKSTTTKPEYADYMFRKMIHAKILAMVKQRRYQVGSNLSKSNEHIEQAIRNAMAKLEYMPNWTTKNWRRSLMAIRPNLIDVAPTTGKFQQGWEALIDGVDTILQVPDITQEIKHLVYG